MALDKREIEHIARLARLALSPEEIARLEGEFEQILDYVDRIQSVAEEDDSTDPAPDRADNVFREDRVTPGLTREEALQNAPDTDGVHFRVPPVLPTSEP